MGGVISIPDDCPLGCMLKIWDVKEERSPEKSLIFHNNAWQKLTCWNSLKLILLA
jgi:hypothetical protein